MWFCYRLADNNLSVKNNVNIHEFGSLGVITYDRM
jgi:hypothetical protein